MNVIDIPYFASHIYAQQLEQADGLIWHHQGQNHSGHAWLSAWPSETYEYLGNQQITQIDFDQNGHRLNNDWFDFLKKKSPTLAATEGFTFTGGLAGHLSYDLGLELLNIPSQHTNSQQPLAVVGLYHWAINVNHNTQTAVITIHSKACPKPIQAKIHALIEQLNSLAANNDANNPSRPNTALNKTSTPDINTTAWQPAMTAAQYSPAFDAIKNYIIEGDAYQVNLTRQWQHQTPNQTDLDLYQTLISAMPAPFSVFQRCRTHTLLSVSPERFIKINAQKILTQPIKGTIARGTNPEEDEQQKQTLQNSTKDQAENLMIVDLLRNDLAKNSVPQTVVVEQLFAVQSFKNVHHLVSTITSQLKPLTHPLDALRDAFPGGSITGAPKKRAMEIIDELETVNRGTYCGSSFYLNADGTLDSNILIRTINYTGEKLTCSGGGGIVFDSDKQSEFAESEVKVAKILNAMTSI